MTETYPVVVVREGRTCWAYVPDLPGVYGLGKTAGRAKADLREALETYIEDCRSDGDPIPHSAVRVVGVARLAVPIGR